VKNLNSKHLRELLLESMSLVNKCGGRVVSLVCDNCTMNQAVYKELGDPGEVVLDGRKVFLVYDYVCVFKNIRNNWITENCQELEFTYQQVDQTARWNDIKALHEEDAKNVLRLTKLTHTSAVFPKLLQRQSVPLVCKVFNEKNVAALKTLQQKLSIKDGTILFVSLISDWFKIMNVKDKL